MPIFMQRTGLSKWAMMRARQLGLCVINVGRRRYVRGEDFHSFLGRQAELQAK